MKSLIKLTVLILLLLTLLISTNKSSFAIETNTQSITSRFYKYQQVFPQVRIPTVIEMPLSISQNATDQFLVVEENNPQFQPYKINYKDISPSYMVYSSVSGYKSELSDNQLNTYVDYQIDSNEIETLVTWNFIYTKPINSNAFFFNLDGNSRFPKNITIEQIDFNNNPNILVKEKVTADSISFPSTTATNWRVTLTFDQPIRINEMGFATVTKETKSYLRFLARPNKTYYIYSNPNGYVDIQTEESGNLIEASETKTITAPTINNNNVVIEPDNDNDGIFDNNDNCIFTANSDQIDLNANKKGDACEDFDNDSVYNSVDNCPDQPNKSQKDSDSDGIGDHCDSEESRLTERIKWLPWLGIGLGFLIVVGLLITTIKTTDQNNNIS